MKCKTVKKNAAKNTLLILTLVLKRNCFLEYFIALFFFLLELELRIEKKIMIRSGRL